MTGKSDFSPEEWKTVLEGPPSAGLLVAAAQRGGTFRESFSIAKSYAEARKQAGESQLLDEITAAKPEIDHTRFHTADELKQHCLGVLEGKATPEEVAEYKQFVKSLAEHVAEAHREGFLGLSGERVSEAERAAVAEISEALGT
jgi:hypothetical protein